MAGFLISPHSFTNFETEKYYRNEPKLNGVCSLNSLLKTIDGAYIKNLY